MSMKLLEKVSSKGYSTKTGPSFVHETFRKSFIKRLLH
ncbi:hypothetical protein J2127_001391 [Methanococcus voltae]|nr:hypothetical protein [Methanococcus voltae]